MTPLLSPNTQAILLLTAPLIVGRNAASPDLLTPSEYKRLARHLREMQRQPADLISLEASELLQACHTIMDANRLQRLLARGFLLSQAIEHWQARAIWVISRADSNYPRRLKARLKEDAPAVLYGCGKIDILETGGLAVVGSRHVDETLINYTLEIGRLSAKASKTLVSGGAKGIDQAAMRGALEAHGQVSGVLADSLEKTVMNRDHRDMLMNGSLVLISPYDPSAGFNVGHAMQRNKLIYALADAALVVSSDYNKGGTWAGATEQLDKLRLVPVYVRSTGDIGKGLEALQQKGALPWPNPQDHNSFSTIFHRDISNELTVSMQTELSLSQQKPVAVTQENTFNQTLFEIQAAAISPSEVLFTAVRNILKQLLTTPMKDSDIAAKLQISISQTKEWLQRLVNEDVLEKQKKPVCYVVKRSSLFKD